MKSVVTARVGTVEHSLAVTDDFARDVSKAIEIEHGGQCDSSACDITAALKNGFPLSSAFLLGGATETPLLNAVVAAHEENGTAPGRTVDGFPDDWADWTEWHKSNGVECESCGAFNFGGGDTCGNCLKALPEAQEAPEDAPAGDETGDLNFESDES